MLCLLNKKKVNIDRRWYNEYQCYCGKTFMARPDFVARGHKKSCGCLKIKWQKSGFRKLKDPTESSLNYLYNSYRWAAKDRNLVFSLTREDFRFFTKQRCHYCDVIPEKRKLVPYGGEAYVYNGIDRMDNKIGYVLENCVARCEYCNYLKSATDTKVFLDHVEKIYLNSLRVK